MVSLLSDAQAARRALRAGEVTAAELTEQALARAEAFQPRLRAFAAIAPDIALAQARRADRDLTSGHDRGPFHGLPVSVKDLLDVANIPTRLGTPAAGHRVPRRNAVSVQRVVDAGGVIVGKARTHELGLGMITPGARNPFSSDRVTGGSSGGSASGIAAGIVLGSLGTDTSGSVRCPAALCGVVGFKPTFGAVPTGGVAPLAASQDTIGVLAGTVRECAALYRTVARPAAANREVARWRIGVDRSFFAKRLDDGVAESFDRALDQLSSQRVELVEVTVPRAQLAPAASLIVLLTEAAARWKPQLDACPAGFGRRVRAALCAGAEISASSYISAVGARRLVRAGVRRLFIDARLDALIVPTLPVTAAAAGAATVSVGGRDEPLDGAHARFTSLASVTGQPAISVPCGLDPTGLPIGLQVIGRPADDQLVLELGALVEELDGSRAVLDTRRSVAEKDEKGPPYDVEG